MEESTMTTAPESTTGSESQGDSGQAAVSILTDPGSVSGLNGGEPPPLAGLEFSEDLAKEPSLQSFKDQESLGKSYVNLVKKMGVPSEQLLRLPSEDGEGWDEVWNKLGRPEAHENYKFDNEAVEGFSEFAHKHGLTQNQANEVLNGLHGMLGAKEESEAEYHEQRATENLMELQQSWKHDFDKNAELASRAFMQFATPELAELFNETGIASEPEVVKFMHRIGNFLAEDDVLATHPSKGGLTPVQAQTRLDEMLANQEFKSKYFNAYAPGHQEAVEQYTKLFEQAHNL